MPIPFPPPQQVIPAGTGGGAPTTSSYVVIGLDAGLSADRKLTAGSGIVLTDGGADGNATLAADFGAVAGKVTQGNDARLTDARTPTSHAASHNAGGGDALAIDAAAATGSLRTLGTSATAAAAGNDARLSDDRTAAKLRTATTEVVVSGATAPTAGQILKASSTVLATWSNPAFGGGVSGALGSTLATNRWFMANSRGGTATATVAPVAGTIHGMPLVCPPRASTLADIAVLVTATAVGSQLRLALYRCASETDIYPGDDPRPSRRGLQYGPDRHGRRPRRQRRRRGAPRARVRGLPRDVHGGRDGQLHHDDPRNLGAVFRMITFFVGLAIGVLATAALARAEKARRK